MDADNAMVVYVLAYTGMRIGEALALRCGDVDLNRNRINVLRTQSVDADSLLIETLPKGNRTRFVPVPSRLLPKIKNLFGWPWSLGLSAARAARR
ncbi:tyrosine-type recombinase/integrase [Bombiscardovia coagulans]|uniref:Integrase n=1 Tax=Bombiscardovia coagulans TaxID=686666 RepID=A0A261EVE5_9BIFI|nr:tyrosine-type recombinase/integrase [Bombiscardovia coagulans]OZG50850.1 integrase [Bombiscardovia coagulans]